MVIPSHSQKLVERHVDSILTFFSSFSNNQREFMKWFGDKHTIQKYQDWYDITMETIVNEGTHFVTAILTSHRRKAVTRSIQRLV
jgi:hypothetical protein